MIITNLYYIYTYANLIPINLLTQVLILDVVLVNLITSKGVVLVNLIQILRCGSC